MKATNRRIGTKGLIKAEKVKERRVATVVFSALILLAIILTIYFTYTWLNQSPTQTLRHPSSQPTAAILDHLSLSFPNQTFIQTATDILEQAGYAVDYYAGEELTVGFYRSLPTHGYDIIILRVHSTAMYGQIFTSESYSTEKYVYEQLTDQILKFSYSGEPPYYFGISPLFVKNSMEGNFRNATVLMMGCDGLRNADMAKAFVQKGANVYMGWSGSVSAPHTDQTAACLLQLLLLEKQTIKEAVDNAIAETGYDPMHGSTFGYYPASMANQTVESISRREGGDTNE